MNYPARHAGRYAASRGRDIRQQFADSESTITDALHSSSVDLTVEPWCRLHVQSSFPVPKPFVYICTSSNRMTKLEP